MDFRVEYSDRLLVISYYGGRVNGADKGTFLLLVAGYAVWEIIMITFPVKGGEGKNRMAVFTLLHQ
jgi:hypothetical protein